jgi:Lrp/AsnC family leucine-responsive transcriptional regulator
LQADARLSYNELARRVGLSSPTVAERVRRMEDAGIITGYRAEIDPAKVGLPVAALVQLRCDHGRCLLNTMRSADYPEVLEVHKLGGERCAALKIAAQSVAHLDEVVARLSKHGELWTTIILSSPFVRHAIDWEDGCGQGDAAPEPPRSR